MVSDHVHVLLPWPPADGQSFIDRRPERGESTEYSDKGKKDSLTRCCVKVRAENTFLLALDGDVDFQPEAIIKVG